MTPRLNTLEGNPVQLGREDGRRKKRGKRKGEIGKREKIEVRGQGSERKDRGKLATQGYAMPGRK